MSKLVTEPTTSNQMVAPNLGRLPDELLLHILTYTTNDPRTIVHLSHISQHFSTVLNSNPQIFKKMIQFSFPRHKKLRNGVFIGKFWENPIRNGFLLLKQFFTDILFQDTKPSYDSMIKEAELLKYEQSEQFLEDFKKDLQDAINSKDKLVQSFKFSKRDFGWIPKKVNPATTALLRNEDDLALFSAILIVCLTIQFMIGRTANTPPEERSFEKGLWWLPYSFWPFDGITVAVIGVALLNSSMNLLSIIRTLMINPKKMFKKSQMIEQFYMLPYIYTMIGCVLRIGLDVLRTLVYENLGLELSTIESIISTVCSYLHYPGLAALGILAVGSMVPSHARIDKICDPLPFAFISLSLFKYSGSLLSFLPLSLGLIAISVKDIIANITSSDKWLDLLPMSLGSSLSMASFGHFSYFTFAPITANVCGLLYSAFNKRKRRQSRAYNRLNNL